MTTSSANNVLIVGSPAEHTLESSYARAFKRAGWQVRFWNPNEAIQGVVRGGRFGSLLSQFVPVEPWQRKANESLLRTVISQRPDLLLIIATTGVQAGTLEQIRVHSPQSAIFCLFPDSPQLLTTERLLCLPAFDRVFTSSPAWITAFSHLGARQVSYLPFAADMDLLQVANPAPAAALSNEIQFVGNWRVEREEFLSQLTEYDLKIWGADYWRTRTRPDSPLKKHWGGRKLEGLEYVQACLQSKIMLNLMDAVSWPGPNMRTFELPACGAFALAERSDAVLEIFEEGKTIECFADMDEARSKIDFYLTNDAARERIARAAHDFVIQSGHTYHDRVKTLLSWWKEHR